jgi:DNA modification methylase
MHGFKDLCGVEMIYCGDSLTILKTLPSESVDCCVTSPPYWGLRCYLPDKVRLRNNLTTEEIETLKKELTLLGLNDTIRI